jgi:lysophospholipase L1-like esterase
MKTILAFGDSLTWGFIAGLQQRHAFEDRWPNVLAAALGGGARVIEEGLNGRTTSYPDHTVSVERNGAAALPMLLTTHQPLDLIIIMLGTNDLKYVNRCRAFDAALGMENLIQIVKRCEYMEGYAVPQILIMSPPVIVPTTDQFFNDLWGHAGPESMLLAAHYKRLADEQGVHFFNAGIVATCDPTDGGHLDAVNTRTIGKALVPVVKKILANRE